MNEADDDRSPIAIGYAWAARITSIGLEMVLPALLGVWIDQKLGTVVLFLLLGTVLGMFVGFIQLLKIVRESNEKNNKRAPSADGTPPKLGGD